MYYPSPATADPLPSPDTYTLTLLENAKMLSTLSTSLTSASAAALTGPFRSGHYSAYRPGTAADLLSSTSSYLSSVNTSRLAGPENLGPNPAIQLPDPFLSEPQPSQYSLGYHYGSYLGLGTTNSPLKAPTTPTHHNSFYSHSAGSSTYPLYSSDSFSFPSPYTSPNTEPSSFTEHLKRLQESFQGTKSPNNKVADQPVQPVRPEPIFLQPPPICSNASKTPVISCASSTPKATHSPIRNLPSSPRKEASSVKKTPPTVQDDSLKTTNCTNQSNSSTKSEHVTAAPAAKKAKQPKPPSGKRHQSPCGQENGGAEMPDKSGGGQIKKRPKVENEKKKSEKSSANGEIEQQVKLGTKKSESKETKKSSKSTTKEPLKKSDSSKTKPTVQEVAKEFPEKLSISDSGKPEPQPTLEEIVLEQTTKCPAEEVPTKETEEEGQSKQTKKSSNSSVRRKRLRSGLDMIRKKVSASKVKVPTTSSSDKPKEKGSKKQGPPKGHGLQFDSKRLIVNKSLGETLLHRSARNGDIELVQFCLQHAHHSKSQQGPVTVFWSKKAIPRQDVNARDNAGYTPLHEASARGHLEVARLLLEHSANVNASAIGGIRPLHDAIENNHIELARLLLSYGADPHISTYAGSTPLQLCRSKMMTKFLKGFYSDIGIERPVIDSSTLPWKFSHKQTENGFNIFADVPPPDGDECEELEIFYSDRPPIPLYSGLHNSGNSRPFYLLQDVLKTLEQNETEFRHKYQPHLQFGKISRTELSKIMLSQLEQRLVGVEIGTSEIQEGDDVSVIYQCQAIDQLLNISRTVIR